MEASERVVCESKKHSNRKDENEFLDEEEILVYVNFDDMTEDYTDEDLHNCKILGLDTKEPILQIGSKVFGGSWKEAIGTAVFFEESQPVPKKTYFSLDVPKPLKYAAKTQKMLHMKRVFVTPKETVASKASDTTSKPVNNSKVINKGEEEMQTD